MKKLLFTLILSVVMISIQSCTTTYAAVYDQYDEEYVISDNADVNIIITYGTPYYYEGKLWYYLYNGLYSPIKSNEVLIHATRWMNL